MTELNIEGTSATPSILFDQQSGIFEIKGKSFPEESRSFYAPVFEWLEEYATNPNDETLFTFRLEYFNSSSSLIILEILNLLKSINNSGNKVVVSWNYLDIDEDMYEAGQEYAEMVNIPFEYKSWDESEF